MGVFVSVIAVVIKLRIFYSGIRGMDVNYRTVTVISGMRMCFLSLGRTNALSSTTIRYGLSLL